MPKPRLRQLNFDRQNHPLPRTKGLKSEINSLNLSNDRIYLIHISDLYDGKRKRGYLLEISDDTAHQQHMEGIEQYNKNLNAELKAKTKLIQELRKVKTE